MTRDFYLVKNNDMILLIISHFILEQYLLFAFAKGWEMIESNHLYAIRWQETAKIMVIIVTKYPQNYC